jgi:hypothetical protein
VIEFDARLCITINNREQIAAPPELVALAFDKPTGRFPHLMLQHPLLFANPAKFADGVGTGNVTAGRPGYSQSDPAIGRVDGQMDILDVLPGQPDHHFPDLDGCGHQ